MVQAYYGNQFGTVLGPYHDDELRPRLAAIAKLRDTAWGAGQVYAIRAASLLDAKSKLRSALNADTR